MNTRRRRGNTRNYTRKPSYRRNSKKARQAQVRRIKCLLAGAGALVILAIIGLVVNLDRRKPGEEMDRINEACEAYRPQVEEIAAEYEMTPYVDLILAVMMQESSGQGTDVMQAAEGQFNTEYPKEPGGIKDPVYSLRCGIQELKHALVLAEAKGPKDLEAIRLALQGYNFGADSYISYMKKHGHGEWSHDTASDFAKMASGGVMREESDGFYVTAGKWKYGDQYYPEHVLRYYHPEGQTAAEKQEDNY
ncbi:MAG: lysozyme family protein [Blautia sp.]|jgi:hypothetical protein